MGLIYFDAMLEEQELFFGYVRVGTLVSGVSVGSCGEVGHDSLVLYTTVDDLGLTTTR